MVALGSVYSIHVKDSKRWNGEYKVISLDGGVAVVENVATKERDEIRVEFLATWPIVKQ